MKIVFLQFLCFSLSCLQFESGRSQIFEHACTITWINSFRFLIFFYFIFLVEILNALIYWCMLMDQSSLLILALQRLSYHRVLVLYFFFLITMLLLSSKFPGVVIFFCIRQFLISGFIQHACRLLSSMMSSLSRVLHSGWLLR